MNAYMCTYSEVNRKLGTKDYGQLVEHNRKFETFREAVNCYRGLVMTNVNMVGKPVIIINEPST